MSSECLQCGNDCYELMNFDNVYIGFIVCPACNLKMGLQYDEMYDVTTEDVYPCWWLEKYETHE